MFDFFEELTEFSQRVFRYLRISEKESPWSWGDFLENEPVGTVLHFTAGTNASSPIRWFMQTAYQSKASANLVVDKAWPEWAGKLAEGLPRVGALPSMVVQCVPHTKSAYHARRVYRNYYGIEIVNAGELERVGKRWFTWRGPYKPSEDPIRANGKYWDAYPTRQISTVATLLDKMKNFVPLDRVVGHENIQSNKFDPGPAFPIHSVRKQTGLYISDTEPADRMDKLIQWADDKDDPVFELTRAFTLAEGRFGNFVDIVKVGLYLLGYAVSTIDNTLRDVDLFSIRRFQHMFRILVDGDPGPQTRLSLVKRLQTHSVL